MNLPPPPDRPWPRVGPVRRFGPVLAIVLALVAAGTLATVRQNHSSITAPSPSRTAGGAVSRARVPPTYATAAREGRTADYHWGSQCDRSTGRLKLPSNYSPPCVPVFTGKNGGATWAGVTSKVINIVYYQPPPGGLLSALEGAAGTPATNLALANQYVAILDHVVGTYGRTVHLLLYRATGATTNSVAAQADAINVAERLHAFASIGGPEQTPVYAEELARLHVVCISCGLGLPYSDYKADAPYNWGNLPAVDSLLETAFTYVTKDLLGKDAIYAGDPAWHTRKRVFAVVHYEQNPPIYGALTSKLDAEFSRKGLHPVLQAQYLLDLTTLPDEAATIADHLKRSGATTVIFVGDPVMPIYLTKACAAIDYYPEWVITGTVFTDTSTLGRLYDQSEWSHAFGISSLSVPTPLQDADAYRVYRWWYGPHSTPPAPLTASLIFPPLELLFKGIELAGPHLTPATFAAGLFRAPPAAGTPTTPLQAYGDSGAPPLPSYTSPDDYTFLWYDATAKGPDEEGVEGTGLMRYVNGGARYRLGTVPTMPIDMFSKAGSVNSYPAIPARYRPPTFPPWPGSPAARR